MKKVYLALSFLVIMGFANQDALAQCNDKLVDKCYPTLGDYTYLKDFKFKLKPGSSTTPKPTAKFQLILSKNTKYLLSACNAEEYPGKVIFQLFDQNGLLASSYNPQTKKHYETIEFLCKKSGLYYLAYTFEDAKEGCAIGMIGFENKTKAGVAE
jgi:hypothetical protein